MAVVDASVAVTVLIRGEYADWAEEQLAATGTGRSLWAPYLIDAEVGQALRRRVAARKLRDDLASSALSKLVQLPLRRISHTDLLGRAWDLRQNLSFYDAIYVALAERLQIPLLTLDGPLARAASISTQIEVLIPG